MNERERIGKRVLELRTQQNLSQAELAQKAGLMQHHISRIELGKYDVRFDTLSKVAEALDTKIDFIKRI